METGTRFVHTADWQLGLRAGHIPGDDGAAVRGARFEVIGRIAEVARDADARFVVVAGDVFEHHALDRDNTQRTFEALGAFRCPVFLLPGNHDPYTPDALYRSEWWARECPPGVTVLGRPTPYTLDNVTLLPCPLTERHMHDPTAWLTRHAPDRSSLRVGVAHGGIEEFLKGKVAPGEMVNDIPVDLASRASLDYLALGDWHGLGRVDDRTWYSGTPEATGFTEERPGEVLSVAIDGPGAAPKVEPVRVARFSWQTEAHTLLTADDVQRLDNRLNTFPSRATALLELVLIGSLDLTLHARVVTELPARYRGMFRHLRVRADGLHVALSDQDFATLPREGWAGRVVERLRERRVTDATDDDCQRALQQLARIQVELRLGGARR